MGLSLVMDPSSSLAALIVLVAAVGVAVVGMRALRSSGIAPPARGDAVLLLGPSGAGKTATLLAARAGGSFRPTLVSMADNEAEVAGRRVVDFPGHGSQRYRLDAALAGAAKVAFMVDSRERKGGLQEAGEYLFAVFTHPQVQGARLPVRVLLGRADSGDAAVRSREDVEKELLGVLRKKQEVTHSMEDLDAGAARQLDLAGGRAGGDGLFEFRDHPCQISFGSVSASDGRLEDLLTFL